MIENCQACELCILCNQRTFTSIGVQVVCKPIFLSPIMFCCFSLLGAHHQASPLSKDLPLPLLSHFIEKPMGNVRKKTHT